MKTSLHLDRGVVGSREEQIAAHKKQFSKIEGRIQKAWALHKKYLSKKQLEYARIQKIFVYDQLFNFFCSLFDCGLPIYLNGQFVLLDEFRLFKKKIDQARVDNYSPDLFAWFALTLGLVEQREINEMVGYITAKFAKTVPTNEAIQQYLNVVVNSGQLLN